MIVKARIHRLRSVAGRKFIALQTAQDSGSEGSILCGLNKEEQELLRRMAPLYREVLEEDEW